MEMPEGFIELRNDLSNMDLPFDPRNIQSRLKDALDLMKEMAEAMYRIEDCLSHPTSCELTGEYHHNAMIEMIKWLQEPLKKFEEWK